VDPWIAGKIECMEYQIYFVLGSLMTLEEFDLKRECRALVRRKVGLFSDYELATTRPDKVRPEIVLRARNLGALALQLQWVYGDADKAETSYFKINQEAAAINKTELFLLRARNKPNGLAARAISRSGTGHKYWSKFPNDKKYWSKKLRRILTLCYSVLL